MTTFQQPVSETLPSQERVAAERNRAGLREFVMYLIVGAAFGVILVKSEIVSWYRIQEMFRFQSFHMYGILGSAMLTALVSLQLLQRNGARALSGERITVPPKLLGRGHRYWIGGVIFGGGWALTGACPGPLFALIGSGATVFVVTALAALAGTRTYGSLRPRLPH
jgi:uncharacterized membrane protein YedE/YeeE